MSFCGKGEEWPLVTCLSLSNGCGRGGERGEEGASRCDVGGQEPEWWLSTVMFHMHREFLLGVSSLPLWSKMLHKESTPFLLV